MKTLKVTVLLLTALLALSATPATRADSKMAAAAVQVALTPEELQWGAAPPMLPSVIKTAVLEGDPKKAGPFTMRAKLPPNTKIMPHWHPGIEHVTVISGTFHIAMGSKFDATQGKALPQGGFMVMPPHTPHFAWSGDTETIIQIHGFGPWGLVYVNPMDDPSKMQK